MNSSIQNKKCVVQCRVSSLKQSSEGESLENQEKSIRNFTAQRGWEIVPEGKVWGRAISGRKTDRDDFEEVIDFIKSNPGLVDFYVFKSIDRFTRAGSGEYERMKKNSRNVGFRWLTCTA
jgi:site-specific DNA recombinase